MRLRTLLVLSVLVAALVAAVGYWYSERQAAARRSAAWQMQQENGAARQRLEQPIKLPGGSMTLEEFTALIEQATGLEVSLDDDSATLASAPSSTTVHLPRGTFSARSALRLTLGPKKLWANVDRHGITITSENAAPDLTRLRTVVYPLPQPEPARMNEEHWANLLYCNVDPASWDVVGGGLNHVEVVPGALIVVQTEEGHRQVRELMGVMQRLGSAELQQAPMTLPPRGEGTVEGRILAALDEPATAEFVEMPLHDALTHLLERHGVPFVISHKLQDAGVSAQTPITRNVSNVSLRSILRLLLSEFELTWTVENEALLITIPEEAESRLRTVVYPVSDLIETPEGPDFDSLIDLIKTTIPPDSWDDVGGPGSICELGSGWLIVTQTEEVHEPLEDLLNQLRLMLQTDDAPRVMPIRPLTAAEQKIIDALKQPLELNVDQLVLRDAMERVAIALGITIVPNVRRMEETGVGLDLPVTMTLPPGPAHQQLTLLLEPFDLVPIVRDEVVQVTTPEDAESRLETRIYDTRAIIGTLMSADQLEDLLRGVVYPDSWDIVGGPASIFHYRGLLVISHTDRVHEQVERLLAALEEHCLVQTSTAGEDGVVLLDPATDRLVHSNATDEERRGERELSARRVFGRRVTISFDDVSLAEALKQLGAELGVSFVIDDGRMRQSGVASDVPVRLAVSHMTVGGTLDRMLTPLGLDYAIRGGAVWISTSQHIDRWSELRLYDIRALVAKEPGGLTALADRLADFDPSLDFKTAGSRPQWFVSSKQPVQYLPAFRIVEPGWLIVAAKRPLHERLEDWLSEQQTGRKSQRAEERKRLKAELDATKREVQP